MIPANQPKRGDAATRALRGLAERVLIILSHEPRTAHNPIDIADLENTTAIMHQIATTKWRAYLERRTPGFDEGGHSTRDYEARDPS